jgi:hypothetical protein
MISCSLLSDCSLIGWCKFVVSGAFTCSGIVKGTGLDYITWLLSQLNCSFSAKEPMSWTGRLIDSAKRSISELKLISAGSTLFWIGS